jgi:hypothetical protein
VAVITTCGLPRIRVMVSGDPSIGAVVSEQGKCDCFRCAGPGALLPRGGCVEALGHAAGVRSSHDRDLADIARDVVTWGLRLDADHGDDA